MDTPRIITFTIPALLGPGGTAMLKGYAAALVNEVERNGALDHANARCAFLEAGKSNNLRGTLVSAPAHIVDILRTSDASAQAAAYPRSRLVEFDMPVSPGKAMSDKDADTLVAYIGIIGTVAARGLEREAAGMTYLGDGFWTTLFGPDSDAIDPMQGRDAANLATQWSEGLTDRTINSGSATIAQELLMMRLVNILAMIPRVANHLWIDLYADTMLAAENPEAVPHRPAA